MRSVMMCNSVYLVTMEMDPVTISSLVRCDNRYVTAAYSLFIMQKTNIIVRAILKQVVTHTLFKRAFGEIGTYLSN